MSELKLEAATRQLTGRKVGQLRRQGLVPVVVYGNVKEPVNLQVEARQLERMLHGGGSTRVVEVTVTGGGLHNVLVKNVQREPVGHRLLHADFFAVNMSEKQHVAVPMVAVGKPAGMTAGMMLLQLHEVIHIEALPADIPGEIEVDVSPMTLERPITVADLPQVKGVVYVDHADEVIFNLQMTKEEISEEAAAAAEEAAEPEVVKKSKPAEDED
jgi:large subunit ribosomal protein L25